MVTIFLNKIIEHMYNDILSYLVIVDKSYDGLDD